MVRTRRQAAWAAFCLAPILLGTIGSAAAATDPTPRAVARTVAGWSDVTDSSGQVWTARKGLVGGASVATELVGKDVLGTDDDPLYRIATFTSTGYATPVVAGRYQVRLLMAEGYYSKAGQRVFDVTAEGATALSRVDIAAAVGRGTAYDRTFEVEVTDGTLNLGFVKVVDNPLIAAVEVTLLEPAGTATSTSPGPTEPPTTSAPTATPTEPPTTAAATTPPTSDPSTSTTTSPTTSTPAQTPRIVARSIAAYSDVVDPAGNVWKARAGFSGSDRNSRALAGTDIKGTTDDVLYRELTFGTTGYSVPLAAGRYRVRLLMAEDYYTAAGKRVFDVSAQGSVALGGVDIAGAVGRATAYDRVFDVDVTTGSLNLQFVAVIDRPQFAAIEVALLGPVPATPTVPSVPTTSTTGGVPTTPPTSAPATVPPDPATVPPDPTTVPPDPTIEPTTPPRTDPTTVPTDPATGPSPTEPDPSPSTAPSTAPSPTPTLPPTLISDGRAPVPVGVGSPWITRIEDAPLDPNSALMAANLRADVVDNWGGIAAVNSNHYNTSFYSVPADQPRVDVDFIDCQNKKWVDPNLFSGPAYFKGVPIPDDAKPARGTDAELTVYDPSSDQLWEFWQARRNPLSGTWEACWGGRIDDLSTSMGIFPKYYGATGTGVAMAAGMIGLEEVRRGSIDHAMYLGVMNAQAYPSMSWPALRSDGNRTDPTVVREGQRLRLDPALDLSRFDLTPFGRMVAMAAQKYGFVVSDRSGAVAVVTEAGLREQAVTGVDPWPGLFGRWQPYEVLRNFPWEAVEVVEADWGKPVPPASPTTTPS